MRFLDAEMVTAPSLGDVVLPATGCAPPKNAFQRRIDRLTRAKNEALRQAESLESENQELRGTVKQLRDEISAREERMAAMTREGESLLAVLDKYRAIVAGYKSALRRGNYGR